MLPMPDITSYIYVFVTLMGEGSCAPWRIDLNLYRHAHLNVLKRFYVT